MATMKTPGVYIVEKNAFPNSVVAVPTAVPAFIGHTEFAMNGTTSLQGIPFRITSMLEYETYFGGAPEQKFQFSLGDFKKEEFEKILRDLLIDIKLELETLDKEIAKTNEELEKEKAKSAPDPTKIAQLTTQLEELNTKKATSLSSQATQAKEFDRLKKQLLDVVNPVWQLTSPDPFYTFYYNMALFFANGGGACYIVSVGDYSVNFDLKKFESAIDALEKEQEPTMIIVPEAVSAKKELWKGITEKGLGHCGKMKNRITILDVFHGYKRDNEVDTEIGKGVITYFRESVGTQYLDYAAAYYPWVDTSVVSDNGVDISNLKQEGDPESLTSSVKSLLYILEQEIDWSSDPQISNGMHRFQIEHLNTSIKDDEAEKEKILLTIGWTDTLTKRKAQELAGEGKEITDENIKEAAKETLTSLTNEEVRSLASLLLPSSQCGKEVMKTICQTLNRLPLAATMAGIYSQVDNDRGVWKAPANISINKADSVTVNLTNEEQESLNVDLNGKSINAIRYFKGEGIKVWGARTLLGNSLDWRYINVRRTMIFLEESIKNAAKAYVFEPNVASTWLNMKAMIENFLMGIWKQGGLAGASPEDAYSVHVGLGDTMTANDILEGILRITVLVAVSHPAEFIEITFQQQMQKS